MALTIDVMHMQGLSNDMRPQLPPKKTIVVVNIHSSKRRYTGCTLLTRQSASVLQVDVSYKW